MEVTNPTEAIHPLGEGEFAFPTPGGRVRLSVTNDSLTAGWSRGPPLRAQYFAPLALAQVRAHAFAVRLLLR